MKTSKYGRMQPAKIIKASLRAKQAWVHDGRVDISERCLKGRCHRCEKRDGNRHLFAWKRGSGRLLRDARCPRCNDGLKSTSNELRGSIVRHSEEPIFGATVTGEVDHFALIDILSVPLLDNDSALTSGPVEQARSVECLECGAIGTADERACFCSEHGEAYDTTQREET